MRDNTIAQKPQVGGRPTPHFFSRPLTGGSVGAGMMHGGRPLLRPDSGDSGGCIRHATAVSNGLQGAR